MCLPNLQAFKNNAEWPVCSNKQCKHTTISNVNMSVTRFDKKRCPQIWTQLWAPIWPICGTIWGPKRAHFMIGKYAAGFLIGIRPSINAH